jgi:hypothetical protein
MTLAGNNGVELRRDLRDKNDDLLVNGVDLSTRFDHDLFSVFGFEKTIAHNILEPVFKIYVSRSKSDS